MKDVRIFINEAVFVKKKSIQKHCLKNINFKIYGKMTLVERYNNV